MNALILLMAMTTPPKIVQSSEAVFPPRALDARVGAIVQLRLDVDERGAVETATVTQVELLPETPTASATTAWGFERVAVVAGRGLRFSPVVVDGAAVPFVIDYTYRFVLPPRTVAEVREEPRVSLRGVVREAGRRRILSGVSIVASRAGDAFEATTAGDGAFEFYDLTDGVWTLTIDQIGYRLATADETVRRGEVSTVTYYLERTSEETYDVIVEATKVRREVTKRELAIDAILKVPGTLGDPVLGVENLPGVARSGLDGGNVIRGSSPQDSLLAIEGVPITVETHLGGFRSVIAPQLVERIDFTPGNFSTRYGRRTGGVLDVRLKRLQPDQVHGEIDLSLLDASLFVEVPITDTWSVAVAGRRSYIDFVLGAALDGDGLQVTVAPRYYDYQLMTSWRPNRVHEFEVFLLGSDDAMTLAFDDVADTDARATSSTLQAQTAFQRLWLKHRYTPSATIRNEASVAVGRDDFTQRAFGRFDFQAVLRQLMVRDELEFRAADGLLLIGGLDVMHQVVDFDITAPRPPKEGQPPDSFDTVSLFAQGEGLVDSRAGLYVEAELQLTDELALIPGIRGDYFSLVDRIGFDPRLVARYQLSNAFTAKAGIGRVHQQPELDEVVEPYGNPDLELISATHVAIGGEWSPNDVFFADLTLFYKDLRGMPKATDAFVQRDGGPAPLVYDSTGRGQVYGLEVMLRHKLANDFEGWLSYTLSRAERTDADGAVRLFDYDQTHVLAFVGTYHLGRNWSVGARWRFVTGRPTTPLLGGVWRAERDAFEAIPGAINSSRLPAFHQLDLRVDKAWVFDTWQLAAYLSVSNAYNRSNVEDQGYNFDYTQTDTVAGLPILPIIGVKGAF